MRTCRNCDRFSHRLWSDAEGGSYLGFCTRCAFEMQWATTSIDSHHCVYDDGVNNDDVTPPLAFSQIDAKAARVAATSRPLPRYAAGPELQQQPVASAEYH